MRIVSSLVLIAVVVLSPWVRAETIAPLIVERAQGAERCPDAESISARVEQIRGRAMRDPRSPYRVTFARKDDGFIATIRTDASAGGIRTLEHDGPQCAALGNAVAVTLALLFDADIEPKKKPDPTPAPAPDAVAPPVPRVPPGPSTSDGATFSLGAAALAGILRPVSPAFLAEAGVGITPFRVSAGALWAWPQTVSLGPGEVHERLIAGLARICWAPWQGNGFRLDACSGALVGAVTADAEGYTRNERRVRSWIVLPFEAALAGWTSPMGWEVSLAALLPLHRPDFSIDGVGVAYRSPPLGAMLSLRALGIFPW